MGGAVASAAGQAVGGLSEASKALYGVDPRMGMGTQTGATSTGNTAQNLLFGNQPQGAQQTPAQMLRRNSLAGQ